jgi:hypothetical protein
MLDDRIEWIVVTVLLVALAIMTAAVFIGTAHGAAAVTQCRMAPDRADRQWWSWRTHQGKRCWYRGRPGRDRAALRWAPVEAPKEPELVPAPEPLRVDPPVVDLPPVPVQQQLASYQIVRLAAPPKDLSLPPLPYPRPKFLEAASPFWLLAPIGLAVALRLLFLMFCRLVRRKVWGSV